MRHHYEGNAPRILFVCSAGLLRSPTAAFRAEELYGWNTRSCGVHIWSLITLSEALVYWAELIVCMEAHHAEKVRQFISDNNLGIVPPIAIMGIEDFYRRRSKDLITLVDEKLSAINQMLEDRRGSAT